MGRPINALDTLISGIAVSNGAEKIVTSDRDLEEVAKVADVKIQLIRREEKRVIQERFRNERQG